MKTASLLENLEFQENRPAISVLFETDFTKEIRIAMKNGQAMKEHRTSFPIVVQIVKGSIEFTVLGNTMALNEGSLIALDGNVPHSLIAKKESIVRLTLTKSDEANRVRKVAEE